MLSALQRELNGLQEGDHDFGADEKGDDNADDDDGFGGDKMELDHDSGS